MVLAAGSRPCAGAVLILVFCAAQGMLAAGIAATFAMALGTALTTGALASLAVFAKALALRFAGGRGQAGIVAVGGLELLAGAFVLVLGLAMLSGLASGLRLASHGGADTNPVVTGTGTGHRPLAPTSGTHPFQTISSALSSGPHPCGCGPPWRARHSSAWM